MSLITFLFWLLSLAVRNPTPAYHPPVINVRFDGQYDIQVSLRLRDLYQDDQNARYPTAEIDVARLIEADRQRREEVITYLQAGQISGSADLFYTALIFQHGDCPDHYRLAADLALRAYEAGNANAGWLYTAATDRYLLSVGNLQRYGTQYVADMQSHFVLCPVSGSITDAERAELGLPTLAELRTRAADFDDDYALEPHPLAGFAGFPVLGDVINQTVILSNCMYLMG